MKELDARKRRTELAHRERLDRARVVAEREKAECSFQPKFSSRPRARRKIQAEMDQLRESAYALARAQRKNMDALDKIEVQEASYLRRLDSTETEGTQWSVMLGPKPTEGMSESPDGALISFEERQQALALRWQLDRLQVVLRLAQLGQQWQQLTEAL